MSITCTHCNAAIGDDKIDHQREIATCPSCKSLVDVRQQLASMRDGADGAEPAGPRMRAPVSLPSGMRIDRSEGGKKLVITRRWLRGKHFVFLAIIAGVTVFVAYRWSQHGSSTPLILGALFLASWYVRLLGMFVNTTRVEVSPERIAVTHGPVPSLMFRPQTVAVDRLKQLFAKKFAAVYEVLAELDDGTQVSVVRPLVSQEQALFVEQQLENALGIVDFEVDGELAELPEAARAAVGKSLGAGVFVLPLVLGGFALVYLIGSSDVHGTLTARGERLGNFTFSADNCSSGQLRGFFGVQLTASKSPGTSIRLIRDPADGSMIAVERNGGEPIALRPDDCRKMDLNINRTNSSYNDVWIVEGSATIDCDELAGTVTFDGCH